MGIITKEKGKAIKGQRNGQWDKEDMNEGEKENERKKQNTNKSKCVKWW